MTQDRRRKREVRALMAELGVSYTAALKVWQQRRAESAGDNESGQETDEENA